MLTETGIFSIVNQERDRVLRAEEDAPQVRVQDRIPRLDRALVDGAVAERAAADAGAVEQDVEPLEAGEEGFDLLGLSEIGLLTVEPDHLGARSRVRRRDGAADPAGRAGDDCNLP